MSNPQSPPHHPKPTERLRSVKQTCGAQKDQVYKCLEDLREMVSHRVTEDLTGRSPPRTGKASEGSHHAGAQDRRKRWRSKGSEPPWRVLLYILTHTFIHIHSDTHVHTNVHTHITHADTHSRTLMHTSVHSYMHARAHTRTHSLGLCTRMFWELMHVSTEACSKGDGGMWPPPTSHGCSGLHSPHVRLFVSSPGAPERAVWAPRLGDAGGQSTRKSAAVPQDQDTKKLLEISATYSSLSPS